MRFANKGELVLWLMAVVVWVNPRIQVAAGPSPEVSSTPGGSLSTRAWAGIVSRSLQDNSCSSQLDECQTSLEQKKSNCNPTDTAFGFFEIILAIFRFIFGFLFSVFRNCASDLDECTKELDNFVCNTEVPPVAVPDPTTSAPVTAPAAVAPADAPTITAPIVAPAVAPTISAPVEAPTLQVTTFYAIGDVPYTSTEATIFAQQMASLPNDAAFLVHVGDIRRDNDKACEAAEFSAVATILSRSPIPVFLLVGDNEYTDCGQGRVAALQLWKDQFLNFESQHWTHPFAITRQPNYEENFSFVHGETLFIGLNIPGGSFKDFWTVALSNQLQWTLGLINEFISALLSRKGRIVLFGHAKPNSDHVRLFFGPLATFIAETLNNETPFLYMHGDGHYWLHNPGYLGQESLLQIMVRGGASEPPLKMFVAANGQTTSTAVAFTYDRQL